MKNQSLIDNKLLLIIASLLIILLFLYYLARPIYYYLSYPTPQETTATNVEQITIVPTKPSTLPAVPALITQSSNDFPALAQPSLAGTDELQAAILKITNEERAKSGRSVLVDEPRLRAIAGSHSADMAIKNYLDHVSKDGMSPFQRVGHYHRSLFGTIRENVALIDSSSLENSDDLAKQFMEGWMNSPGHRRNILAEDPTHLGVGCYQLDNSANNAAKYKFVRRCTQLFADIYAVSEADIPAKLTINQTLPLRIRPTANQPLPAYITQIDLHNGKEISKTLLSSSNGIATGDLIIKGNKNEAYQLQLAMPDGAATSAGQRYVLVTGSYFMVE